MYNDEWNRFFLFWMHNAASTPDLPVDIWVE